MPEWRGQSKGTPLGYRIFVYVVRHLGLGFAYALLRFVAFYYVLFSWTSTKHIYHYFRHRHKFSFFKSLLKIYDNYYVFGQTILDKIVVMAGIENKFSFDFDGEHHLQAIIDGRRGGILISGHVGNWEVAGHLLKRLDTRVNVVMFDAEHKRIKEYIKEVTGGRNFNVIVIKDDMSHVYEIGDALKRNELVCLHADRFVEENKLQRVEFLESEARFPLGPFVLSAAFNVPVSIVFAFKETNMHYHFYGTEPLVRTDDENKKEFTQRLLIRFVAELEEKVKAYPEQWFNYYNFWS